ncbi:MAG TPA: ATP-binding cassette domain-containing protein [Candidatus Binataceae bacterium]|nr:ATP-binding cassette domain-containing protein [Candidatus Binataceae bacterium]
MAGPAQLPRQRFEPSVPAIEADAIGFNYGERRALSDVSFEIARGEIFGFLGPNGGGKTTLFRLLSTLVAMQSGRARVLGLDLAHATRDVRRRMGVVFQHPSVDGKLSVLENLQHHGHLYGMSGKELSARAATMLEQFGIANRSGDRVETLSGGLRRRVELAKALLHSPELLLLDEPSTGLDPVARREFLGIVSDLRAHEGVTVVLTTHYMEEAERCDRIGLLHQGKLVAIASPSELKSQVGGDVIVIHAGAPEVLQRKVAERFKIKTMMVDGAIRIERSRGHELVRDLVEAFGSDIDSISFGKPTLEDVFVHLTGEKFFATEARA